MVHCVEGKPVSDCDAVTAVFPSALKDISVSIVIRLLTVSPVSAADNHVKCPCNNFIKRHFNRYFVNNNNNINILRDDDDDDDDVGCCSVQEDHPIMSFILNDSGQLALINVATQVCQM